MWDIATNLYSGLGLSLVDIILLITAGGALITAVEDVRIGIMCATMLFLSEFIIFYELGYDDYYKPLIVMMLCVVLLIISLMISYPKNNRLIV